MGKRKPPLKAFKLTREERAIERDLLDGKYVPVSDAEFRAIAAALERRRKDAVLHIRINRQDLDGLKRKARGLGVPYQTMIAELLHRFAS